MPTSGRKGDLKLPLSPEYLRATKIIKKALLYGYSVPISFNIVTGSVADQGTLRCVEPGCWDAELAEPGPASPHANHAVLMIDYRTADSSFQPVAAAGLDRSMDEPAAEWVIKNSWGLNGNTSANPELLKRFPLPAYTIMTADFYEASSWLIPDRYE